jgi:uncharacterized membrane protein
MNKQEFLAELKGRLHALGEVEIKKTLAYYGEIIDDRVEEGMTEEDAIAGMESVGAIAERTLQEAPLGALLRARKPGRLSAVTIVLLVLGSPVWLPLLLSAAVIVLSLFIVLWSLVASLWAVVVSFAVAGLASVASAPFVSGMSNVLMNLGAGLALVGAATLLYTPAVAIVRQGIRWMSAVGRRVKSILIRKEVG